MDCDFLTWPECRGQGLQVGDEDRGQRGGGARQVPTTLWFYTSVVWGEQMSNLEWRGKKLEETSLLEVGRENDAAEIHRPQRKCLCLLTQLLV